MITQTVISEIDQRMLVRAREFVETRLDWDNARNFNDDVAWEAMDKARRAFTVEDLKRLGELSRGE